MTRKQAQLLEQVHESAKSTEGAVKWLVYDIRVNGTMGIENILREQHQEIKDLKPKVGEVYDATAKIRSTFKFTRAFKEFLNTRPLLKKISQTIIGKVVVQLAVYLFWLIITLAGFDLALHTIKNAVEMLIR